MDSKVGTAASNPNDFEPSSDFIEEEECNTLLIYLPGFKKEQLKVQLKGARALKIRGTRPLGDNKWSSFQKDFPVSENCDTNKISAKFEDGILYVRLPKLIVPAEKDDHKIPPSETPPPQKPHAEVPPPPKIDQEHQPITPKTTPTVDDVKHFPEKPVEKKEEKPIRNEEKISEPEGDKMDERSYVGDGDDQKVGAIPKMEEYNKVINAAAKLKKVREKMMKILLFLFAFALGLYVSNLSWFSRKIEN